MVMIVIIADKICPIGENFHPIKETTRTRSKAVQRIFRRREGGKDAPRNKTEWIRDFFIP